MSQQKVILVLVDGMRPDGLVGCGHPFVEELLAASTHCLTARTVMPSVTLPCHMSLFHSVTPDRHGILSNDYVPQVRPIVGLFDQLDSCGKKCAFFYTWENLRDLSRPDHLHMSVMINQHRDTDTDTRITEAAIPYILAERPDFLFLYLGETDEVGGHSAGWMSETYMGSVHKAVGCIEKLYRALPPEYVLMVIADHGGHDRCHGTDMDEDMNIPVVITGGDYGKNVALPEASILDIAPTVAHILGVPRVREWEGNVLF